MQLQSSSETARTASSQPRPNPATWRRQSSEFTRPARSCVHRRPLGSTATGASFRSTDRWMPCSRHTVVAEPAPRIGLNLLHLVPGETGGSELYARRLIPALLEVDPSFQLTLFVAPPAAASLAAEPWSNEVAVVTLPVDARSRLRRVLAEQTALPRAVRRTDVKLLHNLFTTAPALPPVSQVTTILDVVYRRFPETHAGLLALGMRMLVPLAARRSKRI